MFDSYPSQNKKGNKQKVEAICSSHRLLYLAFSPSQLFCAMWILTVFLQFLDFGCWLCYSCNERLLLSRSFCKYWVSVWLCVSIYELYVLWSVILCFDEHVRLLCCIFGDFNLFFVCSVWHRIVHVCIFEDCIVVVLILCLFVLLLLVFCFI